MATNPSPLLLHLFPSRQSHPMPPQPHHRSRICPGLVLLAWFRLNHRQAEAYPPHKSYIATMKVRDLMADPQLHSLGSIIPPFTAVGPIPNNNYTRHQLILARYGPNQRGSGLDCTGNLVHDSIYHPSTPISTHK